MGKQETMFQLGRALAESASKAEIEEAKARLTAAEAREADLVARLAAAAPPAPAAPTAPVPGPVQPAPEPPPLPPAANARELFKRQVERHDAASAKYRRR